MFCEHAKPQAGVAEIFECRQKIICDQIKFQNAAQINWAQIITHISWKMRRLTTMRN